MGRDRMTVDMVGSDGWLGRVDLAGRGDGGYAVEDSAVRRMSAALDRFAASSTAGRTPAARPGRNGRADRTGGWVESAGRSG